MRVVSYNILDGGVGRADPLAEVLLAQRADIIGVAEADDLDVLNRLASRLSMDFVHAQGNADAVALLSRWPIVRTINRAALDKGLSKSCLEATVLVGPGGAQREWTLGVVHLHARATESDEDIRQKEIARVLDIFAPHRAQQRPHLLIGDFNATSPVQQVDPNRCKPATQKAWRDNGGDLPRRVVQDILSAGYIDSLVARHGASGGRMASFSTHAPGQRVDYIFTFGITPARLRDAWIETDRLAQFASDHFPVGVEIADEG